MEVFADSTIYLGVTENLGAISEAYTYHEESGRIQKKEGYSGVNALFTLPIDKRKGSKEEAKKYMDQGLLVPDELVVDLVADRIKQDDCANGYVLDGFPRTIPQAEALDAALAAINDKVDYAINVEVPDENIINRMSGRRACVACGATYHIVHIPTKVEGICDKCGAELILRDDDKPETVKNRLNVYHEQTQPLIDYYTAKNVLHEVDGTKAMEDVFSSIVSILGE